MVSLPAPKSKTQLLHKQIFFHHNRADGEGHVLVSAVATPMPTAVTISDVPMVSGAWTRPVMVVTEPATLATPLPTLSLNVRLWKLSAASASDSSSRMCVCSVPRWWLKRRTKSRAAMKTRSAASSTISLGGGGGGRERERVIEREA